MSDPIAEERRKWVIENAIRAKKVGVDGSLEQVAQSIEEYIKGGGQS